MTTVGYKSKISRQKADEEIKKLIERAKEINANPELLVSIKLIRVFGSYLTDKQELGDIDLAVRYIYREREADKHNLARMEKLGRAWYWNCETWFGIDEVRALLRAKRWYISLHFHEHDDGNGPWREIFHDKNVKHPGPRFG